MTVSPGAKVSSSRSSGCSRSIAVPSMAVTMSSALRPASAAGLPSTMADPAPSAAWIQAPLVTGRSSSLATWASTSWKVTPIHGRAMSLPARTWSMIGLAISIGSAKPMPSALPAMAVLMPMSRPSPSSSAPPELPGLMAASVWMRCRSREPPVVMSATSMDRSRPDTMPELHGAGEAALGVADGDGQLPDLEGGRVAQLDGRQVRGVDLDQREVGVGVDALDGALELPAVREDHVDRVGILDDVAVGEDEPVRVDDHAGAGAADERTELTERVEAAERILLAAVAVAAAVAAVAAAVAVVTTGGRGGVRRDLDGHHGRRGGLRDRDHGLVVAGRLEAARRRSSRALLRGERGRRDRADEQRADRDGRDRAGGETAGGLAQRGLGRGEGWHGNLLVEVGVRLHDASCTQRP